MSTNHPLVSVIIPFYNCPYIDQAIASVLEQTYPNVEIVVIDDGSTIHQEKLAPYRSRIHYFGKANGGTASALNHGLRVCSGEYVAWLSSDDRYYPHKIERQLAYMQEKGAYISCTDFDLIGPAGEMLHRRLAVKFDSARAFVSALFTFCPINGCTVMMHRSIPPRIGWFDEALRYTQDYDYWLRVIFSGIDFHFVPEPLTAYRWHAAMGTRQKKQEVDIEFDRVRDYYLPSLQRLVNAL